MVKYLLLLVPLAGCSTLDGFKEEHSLLYTANKAEIRMDKALATQATGEALTAKAKLDYLEAKKEREDALNALSDKLDVGK